MVTVVMPVRNEADSIRQSLGSVLAQDYPDELIEVLVVDGSSYDGTPDVVRGLAADSAINVQVLDNPKRTVPSAMNIGIERAKGDVVVRVDGHCEISRDYVRRCVEVLQATRADNVGGLQIAVGRGIVGKAIAHAMSSRFGVGGATFHYATTGQWVDTVFLGAYRRDVFARIGGFDEELTRNQDDELNLRLVQAGGRIWLDPEIRSVYFPRESFASLWRQFFDYGVYKIRVMQKRRSVARVSHVVPAIFVLALAAGALLTILFRRPIFLASVVGTYGIANGAAMLGAVRDEPSVLPVLPAAYGTMHIAYGLGTLYGLWRWRSLWKET